MTRFVVAATVRRMTVSLGIRPPSTLRRLDRVDPCRSWRRQGHDIGFGVGISPD
jgi:hypothetical protein